MAHLPSDCYPAPVEHLDHDTDTFLTESDEYYVVRRADYAGTKNRVEDVAIAGPFPTLSTARDWFRLIAVAKDRYLGFR